VGTFRFKSDLRTTVRSHQAIVHWQPRLYDCLMVTQVTQDLTLSRLYDCLMVTQITLMLSHWQATGRLRLAHPAIPPGPYY
jgi:hypothetical protein